MLLVACLPAYALDWSLPTVTARYEIAGGASEDPEDDTLEASSIRHTTSLRVKEEADPATFGIGMTYSTKDYFHQAGDYSYLKLDHDGTVRVGELWKLGYSLDAKWLTSTELDADGLSKDTLTLGAGASAAVKLAAGTSLETGLAGRFALAENTADSLQAVRGSMGISSRIGEWLVSARYRGELRLPLGSASAAPPGMYNTASVALTWDPR